VPDLRRLRYFLAVARERNFTRAAARLGIAQPALSRQVRQLEDELGVELLGRTTHSFELTEAGAFLLARGSELAGSADELWRATSSFGSGELGSVVLGYGTSAGYETVPKLLQALAELAPPPRIDARVLPAGLQDVQRGAADLARHSVAHAREDARHAFAHRG
jgi:DNA-binding transcriptional LysR family regulator